MIVIILAGGLGNQMFEYAAARAMSLRVGTDLVLNTRMGFERDKVYHRVFALDSFKIKYCKHHLLSFDFPFGYVIERISRKIGRHVFAPWYKYLYDSEKNRELILNSRRKNVILAGGWINQVYYEDFLDVVRNDFKPNIILPDSTRFYLNEIEKSKVPIVAMGVRVYQEMNESAKKTDKFFYTQGDFYDKAIKYYKEKLGNFKLFIFSQAEDWVRNNINLAGIDYSFVHTSTSDKDAIADMIIMSHCSHYILSNSSYYFWGCCLNDNADKTVVVPQRWTNCTLKEWIKI